MKGEKKGRGALHTIFSLFTIPCYINPTEETVVEKAALIKEIDSLPPRYYDEVVDFVGYIKEKKAKETISLEKAAEMAAEEYRSNKELTSFCALDGEDFYETR